MPNNIEREIETAREDGILTEYKIAKVPRLDNDDVRWIVYSGEDGVNVEAYACRWVGMMAVAHTIRGLVMNTSAKTYPTKTAAVNAVRRAETKKSKYSNVAVRGGNVFVW